MTSTRQSGEAPVLRFGPFTLDVPRGRLLRGDADLPLRAKTWGVLCYLAQRRGCLVGKDDILDAVWPDVVVTEETLSKSIAEIRRALGDDPRAPRYLRTVHGRGFCFLAAAPSQSGGGPDDAIAPLPVPGAEAPIGRDDEIAALLRAWADACAGRRQLVLVAGEPGIGKTTLVDAFLAAVGAPAGGAPVWAARGCCIQQHGVREPYLPVLEALDRLVRRPAAAPLREILQRSAPTWMANLPWLRAPAPAAATLSAEDVRPQRMLREFAAFAEEASAVQPLVLALEDLHWSDPSTVDLLFMLAQRREPARLLVVGTYRPAELVAADHPLAPVRQTLRARRQCREIALAGLGAADVRRYLRQRCPGADSGALAAIVHAHTDGTPLFVVAVVEDLIGRGWLIETDPGWALSVPLSQIDPGVPDDLRGVIHAQLRALRPRDQAVLDTASVIGAEFDAQAVAAAMCTPIEAAELVCERLARAARFLRVVGGAEWPDGTVGRRYAFRHALHRQVVYDGVPDARRRELHGRVGAALARAWGERSASIAGLLAHHLRLGGDPAGAITHLEAAAVAARKRCAPREAIADLESALGLLGHLPAGERRRREVALRLQVGPSLNAVHGYASHPVRQNYDAALALCAADTPAAERYAVLYALWHSYSTRAERAETRRTVEALTAEAARLGPAERWLAQSLEGRTLFYEGAFAAARERLEPLRATWPDPLPCEGSLFGPAPLVAQYGHLAHTLWLLGRHDQAWAACREALALGERAESPFSLAAGLFHAAYLSYLSREPAQAATFADRLVAVAREQEFGYWDGLSRALSGWSLHRSDPGEAAARIESGLEIMRANGARLVYPHLLAFHAEALGRLRRFDAALAAVDEGLGLSETTLDRMQGPELWRLRGTLLAERARRRRRSAGGDAEAAERCLHRSLELARSFGSPPLQLRAALDLADLLVSRGAGAEARALVGPIYGGFTEGPSGEDLRRAAALIDGA